MWQIPHFNTFYHYKQDKKLSQEREKIKEREEKIKSELKEKEEKKKISIKSRNLGAEK